MNVPTYKIGLDFDGVIADTIHLKQRLAEELYGIFIPADKFKEYMVLDAGYLTREQYRALMARVCGDPLLGVQALEVPGAVAAVRALQRRGDHIRIVTSRSGSEVEVIHAWLKERGLALDCAAVGYGNDKIAAVEGFDLYVDDDLPKLLPMVGRIPKLMLFSQPHNERCEVPSAVGRVATWDELMAHAGFPKTARST